MRSLKQIISLLDDTRGVRRYFSHDGRLRKGKAERELIDAGVIDGRYAYVVWYVRVWNKSTIMSTAGFLLMEKKESWQEDLDSYLHFLRMISAEYLIFS